MASRDQQCADWVANEWAQMTGSPNCHSVLRFPRPQGVRGSMRLVSASPHETRSIPNSFFTTFTNVRPSDTAQTAQKEPHACPSSRTCGPHSAGSAGRFPAHRTGVLRLEARYRHVHAAPLIRPSVRARTIAAHQSRAAADVDHHGVGSSPRTRARRSCRAFRRSAALVTTT